MADQQAQPPVEETTATATQGQTAVAEQAAHAPPAEEAAEPTPEFSPEEIARLETDDSHAGSVIGKMLAFFFLYTVVVMAIVGWLTVQGYLD